MLLIRIIHFIDFILLFFSLNRIASPGNRLSHLARRRAIFSSANLQSQSQLSNVSKLGRQMCVIDTSS